MAEYNNIQDFLQTVNSLEAFEIEENLPETFELSENDVIPEGYEVIEEYIGGRKLVGRSRNRRKRYPRIPSTIQRNPTQSLQVYDISITAAAVAGQAATKALLFDLLAIKNLVYNYNGSLANHFNTLLGVTSLGFNANEYETTTNTVAVKTMSPSFHLPTFYNSFDAITMKKIRFNVGSSSIDYVRSAVIKFYSFTPQGRLKTQEVNVSNFIDPKNMITNIIDIPVSFTLRKGDVVLLENGAGLTPVNTALSIAATIEYI